MLSVVGALTPEQGVELAERGQGILLKDLPTGIILFEAALILILLWRDYLRDGHAREALTLMARHMEQSTAAMVALTKAVEAKVARRRGVPQLEAESKSGVGP